MHKNPLQNAGNNIKKTLFSKIFWWSIPPVPPSRAQGTYRADSCPPPKNFLARVRLWWRCYMDQLKHNFVFLIEHSQSSPALSWHCENALHVKTNPIVKKTRKMNSKNDRNRLLYNNYSKTRNLIDQYPCRMRQSCTGNLKVDIPSHFTSLLRA